MLCENIGVRDGHVTFAGQDTVVLAKQYGTPLYLMDEDRIRERCRLYKSAMAEYLPAGSFPLYASKAACFQYMYRIMAEEKMSVDLVSAGEIYAAYTAGFPMENAFFHGNNKPEEEIAFAMDKGVGRFIVDHPVELERIEANAAARNLRQKVLLRLTPGIDPHTYEAIATGKVDSKFGVAIETGQAEEFVRMALACPHIDLQGYHCHVGSQVFDEEGSVYRDAADIMLRFCSEMREKYGFTATQLDLGGGYGVRYRETDPTVDIAENIKTLGAHIREVCGRLHYPVPAIHLEPGRSIVADAGMTLYTAGAVKEITGYKNYVSIDGGMTDNPRYALYGSKYTVLHASRAEEKANFRCDLVGRCCESGDIIQPAILLPKPRPGDIIAVCTTGAYNHSMASNYNCIPRPPVVMLSGGKAKVAVRRETYADLFCRETR